VSSDNPTGADNQQETEDVIELDAHWIVGFVDGEGCFSAGFHRNAGAPYGWQVMPVFQVYQHQMHRGVLEGLVRTAYGMNDLGKQRARSIDVILGSSETVRQAR
jgi:hypothetical protein